MVVLRPILNAIKAVYNFIVGDMIILVGILIAFILLALIYTVSALAALRPFSGFILILAALIVLIATLSREAYSRHR
ncbi:hypothetical protein [Ktedonobacter robiniae]|uniref:Uncharacterized protein n=1 Tax=Ktedonobacter robiniae TaxID=2778365 RepID=A0ABQ3V3R2_9CHLR|nr:hypothetical protein [Ktedonobacter robiniae]GHO59602.1 hypothetical protein KSB_80770 [Ktedonobacter robiniae]